MACVSARVSLAFQQLFVGVFGVGESLQQVIVLLVVAVNQACLQRDGVCAGVVDEQLAVIVDGDAQRLGGFLVGGWSSKARLQSHPHALQLAQFVPCGARHPVFRSATPPTPHRE
jgi:hypothetical protein